MALECPKCNFDNPSDSKFCKECGTQLILSKEVSVTKTLETLIEGLPRGTTFANRYEIIKELGKGGMGNVYHARDKQLNEEVAIKMIKPDVASDKKTIERFKNELRLARKIGHRNVGRMYELMEEEGHPFITMEYVEGEDLKSLIWKKISFSTDEAVSIAKQVCEGLAEAHRLGVVHRDLKPQNIMIDIGGDAKIMDFGIARSVEAPGVTQTGVIIGTPDYISPEQAEGLEADERSDIYSLGVILYEMVTGQVPFQGDTALSVALKHKSQLPSDPRKSSPEISEDLSRLILVCMEKDKTRRYQTAEDLLVDLRNIEEGFPLGTKIRPRRETFVAALIRKKLLIPALVVMLAIIVLAIWQLLPQKDVVYAPKIENSIAIISFKNQTGDASLDRLQIMIPNLLITNLENTGLFHITTWQRMQDILKQMGKKDIDVIDEDIGFKICRREGISALVLGYYTQLGDTFALDAKVLDVESKNFIGSVSSKGKGEDSIYTQIDDLSDEIARGLGIKENRIKAADLSIKDSTTNSLEAYDLYLKAEEAFNELYYKETRDLLERAIGIDPGFAEAYSLLGTTVGMHLENWPTGKKYYERAMALSYRAPEKAKLFIERDYARWIEEDLNKSIEILERIAKKYPRDKLAYRLLGQEYRRNGDLEKAMESYKKALELDPSYALAAFGIAGIYGDMKNPEKKLEWLKKYAAFSPGKPNPFDTLGWFYLGQGKLDDALSNFKKAVEIKNDFDDSYGGIIAIYGLREDYPEALKWIDRWLSTDPVPGIRSTGLFLKGFFNFWTGKYDLSLVELSKAKSIAEPLQHDVELLSELLRGIINYEKGDYERSKKHYINFQNYYDENFPAETEFTDSLYSFLVGVIDLKEGRVDAARSRINEIESLIPKMKYPENQNKTTICHDILLVDVLLVEGSYERAADVAKKISSIIDGGPNYGIYIMFYNFPFLRDGLARAYRKMGELDQAIAEYQRLITFDPNKKELLLVHPKYHYRLAQLYEDKGWKGKAIDSYTKFLSLWNEADPIHPEIEDARKRIAALKN